ncbi:MAG TPA: methionyl-tRNA formyltransferase [Candidatus Acidoferrum sp.]|nr:methionyl-tRNA formyltransferase [Candidatus Acidoferrum sp.]
MSRLRMVFCGTPQFAVPSLQHLLQQPDFEVIGVFTQPDRPKGRGQEIAFSAVKEVALAAKLALHQPAKVREPEVEEQLRALAPDVIVIIAYGQIIPARLLTIPRLGWINLHASLLPKYRGAAPINWAIVNGDARTGNTTMRIDEGMDTGEILLQEEMAIGPEETAPELAARLAEAGAPLIANTLRGLAAGTLRGRPQNDAAASLAPILKREDGQIDWARPAGEIYNRMRGFAPWPGAYTDFRGQICHLWGRPVSKEKAEAAPGALLATNEGLRAVCGQGSVLELTSVKLEGRKQVSAAEFARGARLQEGERLGKV